ncbi:MerR family transcriptional regulator [Actinocorallia populi]|uniref:MerR family transcriptional regulator n=1 Tax=Actinocorallia populi TaxID=2079200 RepID=UPI0013008ABB|nr:MerR family transcriptional regulator [Actinocorallia populi]
MRSGELARTAGVTVRALRHYHQVGVLDEPPRTHNGYRRYGVRDLIRVLRIKRMAALGIPLDRMRPLLDDPGHDGAALLDRLDAELAAEIDRLSERRRHIARIRAEGAAPDTPPELARFLARFADAYPSPGLAGFDRDQSVLLAHLADETAMPEVARLYERLSSPDLLPAMVALNVRFDALDAGTAPEDRDAFVDDFTSALAPVVQEIAGAPSGLADASDLLGAYSADVLNATQRRALEMISERFAALSGHRP